MEPLSLAELPVGKGEGTDHEGPSADDGRPGREFKCGHQLRKSILEDKLHFLTRSVPSAPPP